MESKLMLLSAKLDLYEINKIKHPFKIIKLCDVALPNGLISRKFIYHESVKLSSEIYFNEEEGEFYKKDFILVPRDNIVDLPDGSGFAIKTYNKDKEDYIKTMNELREKFLRYSTDKKSNIERFILNYGHEVFQISGIDIFTVIDKHCKNECGARFCSNVIYRDYILSPILAGLIEKSNISVVEIEFPCQYTNLNRIIRGFDTDPPKINVVFPK